MPNTVVHAWLVTSSAQSASSHFEVSQIPAVSVGVVGTFVGFIFEKFRFRSIANAGAPFVVKCGLHSEKIF
jgi:presenilin-like A22 family membrane protease